MFGSIAKNTSVVEYKKSTGFEEIIGYLYVTHQKERLEEIIKKSINIVENGEA